MVTTHHAFSMNDNALGYPRTRLKTIVRQWCHDNLRGEWADRKGTFAHHFFILDDRDAMLFKLVWERAKHQKPCP